jgi:hypothetical protein
MLIPGNNSIPEEEAKELLKTKDVQERIKIGQIIVSKDADFEEIEEDSF